MHFALGNFTQHLLRHLFKHCSLISVWFEFDTHMNISLLNNRALALTSRSGFDSDLNAYASTSASATYISTSVSAASTFRLYFCRLGLRLCYRWATGDPSSCWVAIIFLVKYTSILPGLYLLWIYQQNLCCSILAISADTLPQGSNDQKSWIILQSALDKFWVGGSFPTSRKSFECTPKSYRKP